MRYFFDTHNGEVVVDDNRVELATEEEAIEEAKDALSTIAAEAIASGENLVTIDIRDESHTMGSITMSIDLRRPK